MKSLRLITLTIVALTICMASCSGEDGRDGINGINGEDGTNGVNGVDGTNGIDGENGMGFDELTKFGYVTMEMEGARPDNLAFTDSTSFKFFPVGANFLQVVAPDFPTNSVRFSQQGSDTFHEFGIARFLSAPDDSYQNTGLGLFLNVKNLGQPTQSIEFAYIHIVNYSVIGGDNMYFVMDDIFSSTPFLNAELADFEFSNIAYDTTTQILTLSYSVSVVALNNSSRNDLTVSGTVDVTLLQQITSP